MVQALLRFREEYEKETGKSCEERRHVAKGHPLEYVDKNKPQPTLNVPTWEYVCWLEKKLLSYVEIAETAKTSFTVTTAGSGGWGDRGGASGVPLDDPKSIFYDGRDPGASGGGKGKRK